MECPACQHRPSHPLVRCPSCRRFFKEQELEELALTNALLARIEDWQVRGVLEPEPAARITTELEAQRSALRHSLGLAMPEQGIHGAPSATETEAVEEPPAPQAHPTQLPPAPVDPTFARETNQVSLPVTPQPQAMADEPALPRQFSWSQVGSYLLSERTLNGLLGLGAFMILAAGLVISTLNPTSLAPLPHVGVVAATTVLFYVSGYVTRERLGLTRAGTSLLAIGAAFIPLLIGTLGQERLLGWQPEAVWAVASLVCLPIYLGSHLVIRDRTFAVLTALAAGSELLSVLHWLGVPLEWAFCALLVLLVGYSILERRLAVGWPDLSWALFWTAQIALPVVLVVLMVGKFFPISWEAALHRAPSGTYEYAVGLAWWLGAGLYALVGRLRRARRYQFAAAWTVPLAYLLTLTKAPWSASWYGVCLGVLALAHLGLDQRRRSRAGMTMHASVRALFTEPLSQTAFSLTPIALLWSLASAETRAAGLASTALFNVCAANVYGMRAWAYLAIALIPAFTASILDRLDVAAQERQLAWVSLAGALIGLAEILVRRSAEARRPLRATVFGLGNWRSRFVSPLLIAGYGVSLYAGLLAIAAYLAAPAVPAGRLAPWPTLLALAALVGLGIACASLRQASVFLYPAALLSAALVTSAAHHLATRSGVALAESEIARVLALLAVCYVAVAWATERARGHYAKPIYLVGYLCTGMSLVLASLDRPALVQVYLVGIGILAWSAWLVHTGRYRSHLSIARFISADQRSPAHIAVRDVFQYAAVWATPGGLLLALSLLDPPPTIGQYGLVLTMLATLFVALAERWRRVCPEYRWPWRLGGYGLSIIGPLVAAPEFPLRTASMALSIGLYAASSYYFRQPSWLAAVAVLVPIWLWQIGREWSVSAEWWSLLLPLLGLSYSVMALILQRLTTIDRPFQSLSAHLRSDRPAIVMLGGYAQPFATSGFVLTAIGLAFAINQELIPLLAGFGLALVQAALWAMLLRESLLSYCLAATLSVMYVATLRTWLTEDAARGVALAPGLGLALIVGEWLRRRADRFPRVATGQPWGRLRFDSWAAPFYLVLVLGTAAMPVLSSNDQVRWAQSWWLVALAYGAVTWSFRRDDWLFPALGATLIACLASIYAVAPEIRHPAAFAWLVAPAALLMLAALWVDVKMPSTVDEPLSVGTIGRLHRVWVRPLLVGSVVGAGVAVLGSMADPFPGAVTATAAAVMAGALVARWRGEADAWVCLVLSALALEQWLRWHALPLQDHSTAWIVAATPLTALAIATRRAAAPGWQPWRRPAWYASLGLAAAACLAALAVVIGSAERAGLQRLALTIALTGLIVITHAWDRRNRLLHYIGVGLVELAYFVELIFFEVRQPQAFAIPAGLYLLGIAYLEWRRKAPRSVKVVVETAGLALLLATTLLQALGFYGAGLDRALYDTAYLLQSTAIVALGALLRWRRSFLIGIGSTVLAVLILLADPLRALETWYLVGLLGLIMISVVIFIEKRRQEIPEWFALWRARLEAWD